MGRPVNKARFFWSGGNNMDARFKAAARLAADLTKCLEKDRAALFTFVAHSHGGNVVTLASKLLADASRVALVGVSTPFLFYRRREIKKGISIFLALSCLFAVLFGVYDYVKVWSAQHGTVKNCKVPANAPQRKSQPVCRCRDGSSMPLDWPEHRTVEKIGVKKGWIAERWRELCEGKALREA